MSGGTFAYTQDLFSDAVDTIEHAIKHNKIEDDWGYCNGYSEETLKLMGIAQATIKKAAAMMQRVDWLMAGDDGEDSFKERWTQEELDIL